MWHDSCQYGFSSTGFSLWGFVPQPRPHALAKIRWKSHRLKSVLLEAAEKAH